MIINNNLSTLINFWEEVEKYRLVGIENHPEYIKKQERELKRQINKDKKVNSTKKARIDGDLLENSNTFKKCIIID